MASRTPASSVSSNSSSDSRAFHICPQEFTLHRRKVFVGLLIVVGASDIHPVRVGLVAQNVPSVCEHHLHEFWKVESLIPRNELADLRTEDVNPHAHQVVPTRFFAESDDLSIGGGLDDAEVHLFRAALCSNRRCCSILAVKTHDRCE